MAAGGLPLDRNAPAQSDVGAVIASKMDRLIGVGTRFRLTLLREKEETVARQAELEAEEKAARDVRYAACKNKKR